MHARSLSLTARTLYAELHEQMLALAAESGVADLPGSLVQKSIRGRRYFYYQYRDLGGRTMQTYLGPDEATTRELASAINERRARGRADLDRLNELRAAFIAAGGQTVPTTPFRVLKGFADAGVLAPTPGSAVLVGTYAFVVLANHLGVRWSSQMQTQDIDIAADQVIDIAIRKPARSAPDVLEQLEMGFIPVPKLDARMPSTSFRVRGNEIRVDLLAPARGRPEQKPLYVPALGSVAQPVRFLDYLVESAMPVVVAGPSSQILIHVPLPERFALHKFLVSVARSSALAVKAEKDREQALALLAVLLQDAPDSVQTALADLRQRGKGWASRLERALEQCRRRAPDVVAALDNPT